jgi:hypothetical protein
MPDIKYISTQSLDYLRTQDNNYLVTQDSGTTPSSTSTTTTTTTTTTRRPSPVIVDYISGFSVKYADLTTVNAVSGFVHATRILVSVNTVANVSKAFILNNFSLYVTFGDGTLTEITSATDNTLITSPFAYDWAGVYQIKFTVVNKDNSGSKTYTSPFSAYNYLTDSLAWNYNSWTDLTSAVRSNGGIFHGYQSCPPGEIDAPTPLSVNLTTSNRVSSTVLLDLYSANSSSQPWELATTDNKYANLRPRWRFTDLNYNTINTLSAGNPTPVYIDAFGTETVQESGTLVGFRETLDFYYIDDIPSLSYSNSNYNVSVPTLWVVTNTFLYPNYQDSNDGQRASYSNSTIAASSQFYVKNLSASYFNLSINGGTIALPGTVWPSITGNFFITINSASVSGENSTIYGNKVLLNYPIDYNNSVVTVSSNPVLAATFLASSFNFSQEDSSGNVTGGFFRNVFYTLDANSSLLSSGSCSATISVNAAAIGVINEPAPNFTSGYNPYTRIAVVSGAEALQTLTLEGSAAFNIIDFDKTYFVRKINETFNYGEQLKSYALQPTISINDNLFAFLSAAAGNSYTTEDNFGTKVYERTANFVANEQDVLAGGVKELYSLSNLIDTDFDNFNINPPPTLKRAFDLFSTSHDRLWGTRDKFNLNFDNSKNHTNLGNMLTAYNINTAIVSAGQKIVLNDIFNSNFYELLEVPAINSYASVTAANMQTYFASVTSYPCTAYPLSAFFGWGVKTPVANYYKFWVYKEEYNNNPVCNLIDWNSYTNSLSTTLSETTSSTVEWYKDGGILENIYSYYLYKGLDLL